MGFLFPASSKRAGGDQRLPDQKLTSQCPVHMPENAFEILLLKACPTVEDTVGLGGRDASMDRESWWQCVQWGIELGLERLRGCSDGVTGVQILVVQHPLRIITHTCLKEERSLPQRRGQNAGEVHPPPPTIGVMLTMTTRAKARGKRGSQGKSSGYQAKRIISQNRLV